jgi:hypothetical protein
LELPSAVPAPDSVHDQCGIIPVVVFKYHMGGEVSKHSVPTLGRALLSAMYSIMQEHCPKTVFTRLLQIMTMAAKTAGTRVFFKFFVNGITVKFVIQFMILES